MKNLKEVVENESKFYWSIYVWFNVQFWEKVNDSFSLKSKIGNFQAVHNREVCKLCIRNLLYAVLLVI